MFIRAGNRRLNRDRQRVQASGEPRTAAAVLRDVATFTVRAVILRHDRATAAWAVGPSAHQSEGRRDKDHAGEGRVDEWHMNIQQRGVPEQSHRAPRDQRERDTDPGD